ncbi:MAG: hypothetical protein WC467_01655 [Patescibacteria group bacterium]
MSNAQSIEAFAKFDQNGKLVNKDANMAFSIALSKDTTSFWSHMKFTSFILVEPGWGESMFGLSYAPASWVEIGLSGGFEQNPNVYRGCATLWLGKGRFSSFTAFERGVGHDNWWYRNITKYKVSDDISLGFQGWRYNGLGPIIEFGIVKHVTIWINPVLDPEKDSNGNKAVIVGLGINL